MSVISLCVYKKRGCFRLSGWLAMQNVPSCHGKRKQLLYLCFSTQISSLPPPQLQLSTASQAPQTSSPLPAQVSSPTESEYVHTTSILFLLTSHSRMVQALTPCLSFQVNHPFCQSLHFPIFSVALPLCVWGAGDQMHHCRSNSNRKISSLSGPPCKVISWPKFHQFPAVLAHLLTTYITHHSAHLQIFITVSITIMDIRILASQIYISPNPSLILLPFYISNLTQSYCTEGDNSANT